jgi:hypothetical protein
VLESGHACLVEGEAPQEPDRNRFWPTTFHSIRTFINPLGHGPSSRPVFQSSPRVASLIAQHARGGSTPHLCGFYWFAAAYQTDTLRRCTRPLADLANTSNTPGRPRQPANPKTPHPGLVLHQVGSAGDTQRSDRRRRPCLHPSPSRHAQQGRRQGDKYGGRDGSRTAAVPNGG